MAQPVEALRIAEPAAQPRSGVWLVLAVLAVRVARVARVGPEVPGRVPRRRSRAIWSVCLIRVGWPKPGGPTGPTPTAWRCVS